MAFLFAPAIGGATFWVLAWEFSLHRPPLAAIELMTYVFCVFLGVPAYFWLRRQVRFNLFNCMVVGTIFATLLGAGSGDDSVLVSLALTGAVTGAVFWAVSALGRAHATISA